MLKPIPINLGAYKNVDALEHGDGGTAHELKNMLITETGANVHAPGLSEFVDLGDSSVNGMTFFGNRLVVVTEARKIYSVSQSGGATEITGTALTGGSRPAFAEDGTYLAIVGGGSGRRWSGSGDTGLMPGTPPSSTFVSYLDGYFLLNLINDQEFRWAGPTSAAREIWNSSNFFQAEGLPDRVLAQAVLLREFYSFGEKSTEIFYNYGDSSVPFKRTFFMDIGIIAPYSLLQADNTLWWLDNNRRFVTMSQRTPVEVSTPFDKVIKGFNSVSDCFGYKVDIEGFYLIVWVFPSEGRTLVFDYKNRYWSEWEGFVSGTSSRINFNSYVFSPVWNLHFAASNTDGKIYRLSRDFLDHDGEPRKLVRRTGYIDHGTGSRKRSNYYLFHVKRGVGTNGETEPLMQIRCRDDGGDWSEPEIIGLGFPGCDQEPTRVHLGGIYRKRQIEVQVTDAVEFDWNKLEEDVELMVS